MSADGAVDRYCADLARIGRRPRTIAQHRKVLRYLDRATGGILTADADQVDAWANRPALTNATRRHYLAAADGFYRWAVRQQLVTTNPVVDLDRPRAPRYLPRPITDDDLGRALALADQRTALWLRLGALAGLRCCEIAELHAEDVADGVLYLRGQKGGGVGCVPLHPALKAALARWPVRHGPLWPDVSAHYVSERCNLLLHRSGSASTMHATRHAFGTHVYAASGGSLLVAQRLLRHVSPTSTAVYVQVADESLRSTVRLLAAV